MSYLKDGRLDALANLVPYVDVSGHFGQDIGPEGWLLRSSPAEGRRVPGCVLQLHAAQQNMCARELLSLNGPPRDRCSARSVSASERASARAHTAARATQSQLRLSDGRNYFRNRVCGGGRLYLMTGGGYLALRGIR